MPSAAAESLPGYPAAARAALDFGRDPVWLALEYLQHTGSFKARGAQNFLLAHRVAGTLPDVGVAIASGGNAGLACAWAARQQGASARALHAAQRDGGYCATVSDAEIVRARRTLWAEQHIAVEHAAATVRAERGGLRAAGSPYTVGGASAGGPLSDRP